MDSRESGGDVDDVTAAQRAVCARFGVDPVPAPAGLKVGVARAVRAGALLVNGLRHRPDRGTTGWYIWSGGEPSDDAEFFEPLHVEHLAERCPEVVPYLQLPPGSRFQIAPGHGDVWQDPSLLDA